MALYFDTKTSGIFLFLDGTLRWVPNPATFEKLFAASTQAQDYTRFNGQADAPHDYGLPLPDGAELVRKSGDAAVYLTDEHPWAGKGTIYRHVISPEQAQELGLDLSKVKIVSSTEPVGAPLSVDGKPAGDSGASLGVVAKELGQL